MNPANDETNAPTTNRARLPLVVVLGLWVVLGTIHAICQNTAPVGQPIPSFRRVVLLVVPGLDLNDRNDKHDAPELANLASLNPVALAPILAYRPQNDSAEPITPDERLTHAFETLLGKNGNLSRLFGDTNGRIVVVDASGLAAPVVFGEASANSPNHDAPLNTGQVSRPEVAGGQATDPALFAQAVRAAIAGDPLQTTLPPPVLVVAVLDDLYRADSYAPLCTTEAAQQERKKTLRRVSRAIAALTKPNPDNPDAVLLVAPLAPASQRPENERMGLLLLCTPQQNQQAGVNLLTSPSTRHTPGLATFGDIPQTLLQMLGVSSHGRSLETVYALSSGPTFTRQKAHWAAQWRETRFLVVVPWILSGLLLASIFYAERSRKRVSAFCALLACAIPFWLWAAPFLPLVTNEGAGGGLFLYGSAALCAAGTAWGLLRKENFPLNLQIIAGATACLLTVDAALGGPLLARSPLSYSPLEGARFYGVGNESAGVFLGASLLFALLYGRANFWARLLGGLGVAALLGLPTLGANAGATVAALAGWGTLLVLDAPASRRKGAAVLAALCAVLLLAGLVLWESHRAPNAQTHIGQVVAQTQNGGANGAAEIARRKIAMNAHLAVSSPWAVLLVVEIGLCVFLWRKAKTRGRMEYTGAIALFVGAGAAFLANDSGVVMAAACLLFAPPLLLTPYIHSVSGFSPNTSA